MWNETRLMRWLLFAALSWTWPLPLFGLDGTTVPVVRFLQLAASLSVLIALEGAGGMVDAFFGLLWGHVLIYGLILFGVASLIAGLISAIRSGRAGIWITIAVAVVLVGWASFVDPYDTMFHHSDAHASLWDLYR